MKRPKKKTSKQAHWTERSLQDFLYQVAADFVRQLESGMEASGTNQAQLAKELRVSEGRVSQVLNNPGNLTLRKVVEYARALKRKVAIIAYDDDDPENKNGLIPPEIFTVCWQKAGSPTDFFALENGAANVAMVRIGPDSAYFPWNGQVASRATNGTEAGLSNAGNVAGTENSEFRSNGAVAGGR